MFKSKSFDLKTEENPRQTEHLYQPRRIRWMKYIIIPIGIGFVILLIVWNIDFSSDPVEESDSNKTQCNNTNNNVLLRIENYDFPEGIINNETFSFQQSLQSLIISTRTLIEIKDGAFDQYSLHNLSNLEIINSQLRKITQNTFQGLHNLRNFTLINHSDFMNSNAFISQLSGTISSVKIQQKYTENSTYKLSDFFGAALYNHLIKLDLSGNNFGTVLKTDNFQNMPFLEFLILSNCRLISIDFDINEDNLGMLRFIDLRGNALSDSFITTLIENGIEINSDSEIKPTTLAPILMQSIEIFVEPIEKTTKFLDHFNDNTDNTESTTTSVIIDKSNNTDTTESITNNTHTTESSTTRRTAPLVTSKPTPPTSPIIDDTTTAPILSETDTSESITNYTDTTESYKSSPINDDTTDPIFTETDTTESTTNNTDTTESSTTRRTAPLVTSKPTPPTPPLIDDATDTTDPIFTETDTTESITNEIVTTESSTSRRTAPFIPPSPSPTDTTANTDTTLPIIDGDNSTLYSQIICINTAKETISNTSVSYNGLMKIVDYSEGAVEVIISQLDSDSWNLIFFSNSTHVSKVDKVYSVTKINEFRIKIEYLNCSTSYTFCLMIEENTMTSPFNCQSHFTINCDISVITVLQQSWFAENSTWIIIGGIIGILVSVTLGIFLMYGILWLRPTLLCGNKLFIRPTRDSLTMVLLPTNFEKEVYGVTGNENADSTITEYVAYYRHLEQSRLSKAESNKYNNPPQESAPSVPSPSEPTKQIQSTIPNTYTYECLDLYEELI